MASTNNYNDSKVTEFPSIFPMYTNPGSRDGATINVPSFVSKCYAGNGYNSVDEKYDNHYDDHTEEEDDEDDEAHARNMTILDLVVHVEEIQSQLENVIGMHTTFRELNEGWLESNAKFVTRNNGDRVSWIVNETRKKNALDKMGTSLEQIQDEMATLSLKSKDLYREHSIQQLHRQHQRIRRSIQAQQKKHKQKQLYLQQQEQQQQQQQQQQQYFYKPTPTAPIIGIISRSKPLGLPPPRPFTMQQRVQTQ